MVAQRVANPSRANHVLSGFDSLSLRHFFAAVVEQVDTPTRGVGGLECP